ncbi:hypothetical protein OCU04_000160 [Sclerotinia nivalis]|uniref:Rhodopsin domain-containing protein n=1 Tax=Sclerotinia nivalis TaxID=352851 RepID=A0A9X0DN45_9HELO|nr:hypothetical protein OCU04_000160 [Sclerotinia nivalis]
MSILFMYNRIFSVSRAFRFQVLSVGAMVMVFWIGCTVANLLNCRPLKWTWLNSLDDPRYCFNYNIFWMASGCAEAFIDVLIITIPIRMTLGLHLDKARKFALAAVFLLGIFVIIIFGVEYQVQHVLVQSRLFCRPPSTSSSFGC